MFCDDTDDAEWLKDVMQWVNGGKAITIRAQSNPDNTLYARTQGKCGGIEVNLNLKEQKEPPSEGPKKGKSSCCSCKSSCCSISCNCNCNSCKKLLSCFKSSSCCKSPCCKSPCLASIKKCLKCCCCSEGNGNGNGGANQGQSSRDQEMSRRMDRIECRLDSLAKKLEEMC